LNNKKTSNDEAMTRIICEWLWRKKIIIMWKSKPTTEYEDFT